MEYKETGPMGPWVELLKSVIKRPAFTYSGVRKLVRHVEWTIDEFPPLTYESLGYKKNKIKQMERNYYNEQEFARVRAVLNGRSAQKNTSVALLMRGKEKDSRSQGWCLLDIIVTRMKGFEEVDINYRSTELTLKFGADLVFIPWVLEQIGAKPQKIHFHITNAYFSGVFLPTLAQYWDYREMIDFLAKYDPWLFERGTRFFLRSTMDKNQRFRYSPENQQHKMAWERLPMKKINAILLPMHKAIGKPLPTPSDF
jgi:hypothetical protein